jgi:hypothetical protein
MLLIRSIIDARLAEAKIAGIRKRQPFADPDKGLLASLVFSRFAKSWGIPRFSNKMYATVQNPDAPEMLVLNGKQRCSDLIGCIWTVAVSPAREMVRI